MFQPYMIIIRLANKKENKYILAFRIEISMLYICICIKYTHINLDSCRNAIDKSCNI
jgi:hypothetical protein